MHSGLRFVPRLVPLFPVIGMELEYDLGDLGDRQLLQECAVRLRPFLEEFIIDWTQA